ncbi:uncharacterized protein LOC131944792 [Physella acuta]|uniref:uncharacterized protein LOC131944792 n=1 Tax=Physella acuta TaxID=109671 RepID=UPI0027DE7106|nr:uncharacterized protein LOC131944792 [Physella acuta]XP_059161597.1 uncharacterized protein LOC131944792 [Physella acuta]
MKAGGGNNVLLLSLFLVSSTYGLAFVNPHRFGYISGPNVCGPARKRCCDGWKMTLMRTCTIPVCSFGCGESGTCVHPNLCKCADGRLSHTCEVAAAKKDPENQFLRGTCDSVLDTCEHTCINMPDATHKCTCKSGYKLLENLRSCDPLHPKLQDLKTHPDGWVQPGIGDSVSQNFDLKTFPKELQKVYSVEKPVSYPDGARKETEKFSDKQKIDKHEGKLEETRTEFGEVKTKIEPVQDLKTKDVKPKLPDQLSAVKTETLPPTTKQTIKYPKYNLWRDPMMLRKEIMDQDKYNGKGLQFATIVQPLREKIVVEKIKYFNSKPGEGEKDETALIDKKDNQKPVFAKKYEQKPAFDKKDEEKPVFDKKYEQKPVFDKNEFLKKLATQHKTPFPSLDHHMMHLYIEMLKVSKSGTYDPTDLLKAFAEMREEILKQRTPPPTTTASTTTTTSTTPTTTTSSTSTTKTEIAKKKEDSSIPVRLVGNPYAHLRRKGGRRFGAG